MKIYKLFAVFIGCINLLIFTTLNNLYAEDSHSSSILAERTLGSDSAPNELIEYASMSCPHCATFHNEEMPKIIKEYIETGKVKYIFRDFPLD